MWSGSVTVGRLPTFRENGSSDSIILLNTRVLRLVRDPKAEQLFPINGQGIFQDVFARIIFAGQIERFPGKSG